ncbi:dihydrodipicolinate synthase family protein [Paractinoplanes ferrugineus]|uniref:Dihydrodipicolinate synthase family protein n=1 Tax=Paractinoplanes ferrugineus TaxID=113564 RepID=A0A919J5U2_9ACTN|nr:DUF993 family protein [Actinoplanes ferrugineus]GIE13134.1 hypothetical protein Afe05nite_49740 [Actinoplanes ferrugineus]
MPSITLPVPGGGTRAHTTAQRLAWHDFTGPAPTSRSVYAAAHVVVDPLTDTIDWDTTLAFRRHLWSLGLGVADGMDTAQRGGGLTWPHARELVVRSGAEATAAGGALAFGAATDQLDPLTAWSLDDLADAYLEQVTLIAQAGATPVLMGSRLLAATAQGPDDYLYVYDRVLAQTDGPVLLHWLGAAFDPAMHDYWGDRDLDAATGTVLQVMGLHPGKVTGIKVSLLDAGREIAMRRRLPAGVRMFTGDDFNYDTLIRGDDHGHSEALLGVFDAIAAPARAALARLDAGDPDGFSAVLAPTVPLARHLFTAPTAAYKTGVVLLAWLNGHQRHFHLLGGAQSARSVSHLVRLFELADEAGALADPDLAVHRMRQLLAVAGFEG